MSDSPEALEGAIERYNDAWNAFSSTGAAST
jgi:hypothetical protein